MRFADWLGLTIKTFNKNSSPALYNLGHDHEVDKMGIYKLTKKGWENNQKKKAHAYHCVPWTLYTYPVLEITPSNNRFERRCVQLSAPPLTTPSQSGRREIEENEAQFISKTTWSLLSSPTNLVVSGLFVHPKKLCGIKPKNSYLNTTIFFVNTILWISTKCELCNIMQLFLLWKENAEKENCWQMYWI